ncbi:hypothetical protein COLU111180_03180 [Cohnella lubricantis]|uniref:FCP1 homology domain-containing protein n=1 Tax=Cohnella lubricantis TaxID=2163172 RepID=A0A841TBB7_9BACL|nr:hypothetical protein [Cohnella lubricantis]MBB6677396.1 hypothetical protein [Cohnella lubricantis]MBP2118713.1 ribonucleotide monophosphatase NagD (HAD superfamily) [Cohnella lubricantis]
MDSLVLSSLGHTWILDLDGTIVRHNGHKLDGNDTPLPGALEFLKNIPDADMVVFITSRTTEYKQVTERFLTEQGIRYDHIIYNAPFGERILVNDRKPSGLVTALAVNVQRDRFEGLHIEIDEGL